MTHDELIEAVAFNMCYLRHPCGSITAEVLDQNIDGQGDEFRAYARAAIAIVLEEAAKVAEQYDAKSHGYLPVDPVEAADQAAKEIAGALRAMKE